MKSTLDLMTESPELSKSRPENRKPIKGEPVRDITNCKHAGTNQFAKRVNNNRKKARVARKARRKNR